MNGKTWNSSLNEVLYDQNSDYISIIAKQFSDLCIQIEYARQNIKNIIQQYAFIGTDKIIKDVIRQYYIKNFSDKSDMRLLSKNYDQNFASMILPTIDELNGYSTNGEPAFFDVSVIEYYDNTNYFNISAQLPSCIIGQRYLGVQDEMYQFVTTSELVSSYPFTSSEMITGIYNDEITYGVISSHGDDFGIIIPGDIIQQYALEIHDVYDDDIISTYYIWDNTRLSSLFIPSGTIVSSIIPPGTVVSFYRSVDKYEDISGLCADFVTDYNQIYWNRDFSIEPPIIENVCAEITYYENYFESLKTALTPQKKYRIYVDEIYPSLIKIWQTFNTSRIFK